MTEPVAPRTPDLPTAIAPRPPAGPLPYRPVTTLMLYLTEDCNLRCTYCFVDKQPRRMSSETARQTVDWFLSRQVSGAEHRLSLNFFGGEPFLELERMEEVVALTREFRPNVYKQVLFSATTNGTVASPRAERVIRDTGMTLLVSLDGGPEASRHRPLVDGRPSYDLVARNLVRLVSWSPSVLTRTTFHPGALDLVDNVRHVLELGAPEVALCPVEDANWDPASLEALEAAYQALADWYLAETRRGTPPPLVMTNGLLGKWHRLRTRSQETRPERPCGVGTHLLAVDPGGHVLPCQRFLSRPQDRLGHVSDPTLSPARAPYVHLSSRDLLGCDGCVAEMVCGGGCRAVALAAGRTLQEAYEGHCVTLRAHVRAVSRIYDTLLAEDHRAFRRMLGAPQRHWGPLTEFITR